MTAAGRPAPPPDRVWAWVTFDEAVAYEAAVLPDGRPYPLLPADEVERLRVDCDRYAEGPGLTDTLHWVVPGLLVKEVSGQWNTDGGSLEDDGGWPRAVSVEANDAGLFGVGGDWTWRVIDAAEVDKATGTVRRQ